VSHTARGSRVWRLAFLTDVTRGIEWQRRQLGRTQRPVLGRAQRPVLGRWRPAPPRIRTAPPTVFQFHQTADLWPTVGGRPANRHKPLGTPRHARATEELGQAEGDHPSQAPLLPKRQADRPMLSTDLFNGFGKLSACDRPTQSWPMRRRPTRMWPMYPRPGHARPTRTRPTGPTRTRPTRTRATDTRPTRPRAQHPWSEAPARTRRAWPEALG